MATLEEVAQTHPGIRHTQLSAILRKFHGEESPVGAIAQHVFSQPHDQPLDQMPFHILRDWLQENPEHPLYKSFQKPDGTNGWDRLPEKLALDQTMERHLDNYLNVHGKDNRYPLLARAVRGEFKPPKGTPLASALSRIKHEHPEATDNDLIESAQRNHIKLLRSGEYARPAKELERLRNNHAPEEQQKPAIERADKISEPGHTVKEWADDPMRSIVEHKSEQFARLRQSLEYQTELEGVDQDRRKWNPAKGDSYPSDSLLLAARNFHKAGDPRGELIQKHADLLDGTEEDSGPCEHASSTRDARLLHHATLTLPDQSQLRVAVHGHNEYPGVHAVSFDWTPKGSERGFFGHYNLGDARGLADRFAKAAPEVGNQIHDALDAGEEKGEPKIKFAALKAPAGGMVSQGTFFKGGQTIASPELQLPERPIKLSRRKRLGKAWSVHKSTLKYPPAGEGSPGLSC